MNACSGELTVYLLEKDPETFRADHLGSAVLDCTQATREGFLRKNIVADSFFQNCAIHQYS